MGYEKEMDQIGKVNKHKGSKWAACTMYTHVCSCVIIMEQNEVCIHNGLLYNKMVGNKHCFGFYETCAASDSYLPKGKYSNF